MTCKINASTTGAGGLLVEGDSSGVIDFQSNGVNKMSLDAAGKLTLTTVDLGDWTITESGGVLYFATGGTNKMKLDASGNLTVTGNMTAYGTI